MFIDKNFQQRTKIGAQQQVNNSNGVPSYKCGTTPKDSFQKSPEENMNKDGIKHETENLQFKKVDIKFYPEDEEKMKFMDMKQKIEYMRQLKAENRYIRLETQVEDNN